MATSDDGDRKKAAFSQPLTEDETTILYMDILTFDLLVNILCRLPVKVLMKLRCVCKSWSSLISDPKFAKEHLRFSRTLLNRHHLLLCCRDADTLQEEEEEEEEEGEFLVWDFRLPSVFNSASTIIPETQLTHPLGDDGNIIDSCNGIICFCCYNNEEDFDSILLWNPSIRKFKILPPLEKELQRDVTYGFGYDHLTDSYKVVALCLCRYEFDGSNNYVCETQVMVLTLDTDTWKSISSFPSTLPGHPISDSGKFVSGAINWLIRTAPKSWLVVALDLGNETSQEILLPNYGGANVCMMTMGVLKDCLCIFAHINAFGIHVWLMKDYGNNDSWTQLFAIPYNGLLDSIPPNVKSLAFALYILEDNQLLMDYGDVVLVYNPRNGTIKIPEIQSNDNYSYYKHVYIESLISP